LDFRKLGGRGELKLEFKIKNKAEAGKSSWDLDDMAIVIYA